MKIMKVVGNCLLAFVILICATIFCAFNFMGYKMFIVLSGSMQPTIMVDDLVIIKQGSIKDVQKGDIITYLEDGTYVTHRVVDMENDNGVSLITQGDNNNTIDKVHPTATEYVGKYIMHISGGGTILSFLQTPFGMVVMIGVPIAIFLIWSIIEDVVKERQGKEDGVEKQAEE